MENELISVIMVLQTIVDSNVINMHEQIREST